eukprot:TRINITY_DN19542_c0_g6_i1.p1 TRINITY_DN19542_c0_g6~~TRINITY_DN19542_c0_g6_i1.p1  ORF type:complete len:210 (+),score=49.86 TRINITY_DN19542_c0_g6_i1:75-704(+)
MLRQAFLPWRALPMRALAKKKGKQKQKKANTGPQEIRLVPQIPQELTKVTRQFFENQPRLKSLLELVFSPLQPKDENKDRIEFERARCAFEDSAQRQRKLYEAHEQRCRESMWRAIRQLPEDLHEEAIASKPERVPDALLFHVRHGGEIFAGLHDDERRKLQVYHNLMYTRYPHSEEKARDPQRFWIPENQVVSRQKEAAMAKKKIKKK